MYSFSPCVLSPVTDRHKHLSNYTTDVLFDGVITALFCPSLKLRMAFKCTSGDIVVPFKM